MGLFITNLARLSKGGRPRQRGFSLLEVLISVALVGGLLTTLLYVLNSHLAVAERHVTVTMATNLAKDKLMEMEKSPSSATGTFGERFADYHFETAVRQSHFPGMLEIAVTVRKDQETVSFVELIRKSP